jgi:tagatose-6-phosphate ketose/aldose isomerase
MLQVQDKTILGFTEEQLDSLGAGLTAREIAQQGNVWLQADVIGNQRAAVAAFLEPLLARENLRIVLTGAGTSAFIGECLLPAMLAQGRRVEAIATTDLVSGPGLFFQPQAPTLLVSFARSGSSPESLAAVALADQLLPEVHHLIITCNAEGALYRAAKECHSAFAILLPDAAHDRGFAMTTSFTSMLLTAALAFNLFPASAVGPLSRAALALPEQALSTMQDLVAGQFRRVVYLGSNALRGLAREAALKLLELTDGQVVALFDSPLGFRHGPKTIVDGQTLVVVMLSNDPHARRYDLDLLRELRRDGYASRVLALSSRPEPELGADCVEIGGVGSASDLELALPYIVFCQCIALLQSLALGLHPDTPSVSGTVSRVVRGVTIHPYPGDK